MTFSRLWWQMTPLFVRDQTAHAISTVLLETQRSFFINPSDFSLRSSQRDNGDGIMLFEFCNVRFLQTFLLSWQPWNCHPYWCFLSSSLTGCQTKNIWSQYSKITRCSCYQLTSEHRGKTARFYCTWLHNDGALNFVQFFSVPLCTVDN